MADGVEGLRVFQLAYALSLDLHRASLTWPKVEQYGGIADQVRRSSKAVCALLAEGVGRSRASRREFERYVVMALGSANEARLWCKYAEDLGYASGIRQQHGVPPARRLRDCCRACCPDIGKVRSHLLTADH